MNAKDKKISIAISVLWLFFSLPISFQVSSEEFGFNFRMQLFSFLLVASPVWIVWGWRWIAARGLPLWLLICLAITSFFLVSVSANALSYAPPICFLVLVVLDATLGGNALRQVKNVSKYLGKKIAQQLIKKKRISSSVILILFFIYVFHLYQEQEAKRGLATQLEEAARSQQREQMRSKKILEEDLALSKLEAEKEFNFPAYSEEDKLQAISTVDFVTSVGKLTALQKIVFLKEKTGALVTGIGKVYDVKPAERNASNVSIHREFGRPYSGTDITPGILVTFRMSENKALGLNSGEKVKFIGRFKEFFEVSNSFKLENVEVIGNGNQ